MPDRKKVIRGLEMCSITPSNRVHCHKCPYNNGISIGCMVDLMKDARALLKEQEARVLSAEEMAQIEPDTVYWGEGNNVRNLWPMAFTDKAIEDSDSGFLKDSYGRIYEVELYNKGVMGWRLWTSRPTEEQRKVVPWDD